MFGEIENGYGKWKLYGLFIVIKGFISFFVGYYSCVWKCVC